MRWPKAIDFILILLSLEFLATGLLVYFKSLDRPVANRFLFLCGVISVALVTTPITAASGQPWAVYLNGISTKAAAAAFACFFCKVPVPRWGIPQRVLVWAVVPVGIWYTVAVLIDTRLFDPLEPISLAYISACLSMGVLALFWPFFSGASKLGRKLWPVTLGSGFAAVVFIGASMLPKISFQHYLIRPEITITAWALLPLGLVWAIFRYHLLGVNLGPWAVLETIFETSTDSIFVIRQDKHLATASRSALALLGMARVKDANRPFEEMLKREDMSGVAGETGKQSLVDRVLGGETVRDAEECIRLPDGTTAFVSVAGMPVHNEQGQVDLGVLVYRDVTARVEMQRLRDEHLSLLAHDLRSPLTILKAQADILLRSQDVINHPNPELHRGIQRLAGSTAQLNALLTELLDVTRLEAGLVTPRVKLTDLAVLLQGIANRMSSASNPERIQVSIPPNLPPVRGDGTLLDRALTNIVANALRYTQPDSQVHMKAYPGRDRINIDVIDNGPGIAEEDLPHIFKRRYRGRSSQGTDGTGLGLYIAHLIVTLHDGTITAKSTPGRGTTFHISLPLYTTC